MTIVVLGRTVCIYGTPDGIARAKEAIHSVIREQAAEQMNQRVMQYGYDPYMQGGLHQAQQAPSHHGEWHQQAEAQWGDQHAIAQQVFT